MHLFTKCSIDWQSVGCRCSQWLVGIDRLSGGDVETWVKFGHNNLLGHPDIDMDVFCSITPWVRYLGQEILKI